MSHNSNTGAMGRAIVVGGGIGGIQCSLDLAEAGFYVYLLDKSYTLGGTMAALDKTFPTNDCSTCMFSPKLVQAAGNPNIEILTGADLRRLEGESGNFSAEIILKPRYIDMDKCIACGQCAEKCPKKVPDPFNGHLAMRKAAFLTFPQAVPLKYALDEKNCLYLTRKRCGLCKKICPVEAVDFEQEPRTVSINAGAVVLAGGFEPALTVLEGEFGYGRYRNIVSSIQYERMLSATGPYEGHLCRPSDKREPKKVAWIQCVLSRDESRKRPFCSSVCCMHAAKQAVLTRSHLPETQTVIYFMDVRAHGKGFDDYIERARHQHGVVYRRSMISQTYLNPQNKNIIIETYDHHLHRKVEEEYDMVVLSCGFQPAEGWRDLCRRLGIKTNPYGFAVADFDQPAATNRPGVFVCGGIETPKDIPETVVQAGTAASEVSKLLASGRNTAVVKPESFQERAIDDMPRVGVFVCHCGSNIAGVVDIPAVMDRLKSLAGVEYASDFMFTCSAETQPKLIDAIQSHDLNRIVVAACSPKTHEPLFQDTMKQTGLNPYLFDMANIRNQCSWVHGTDSQKATEKSFQLIRAAVERVRRLEPLADHRYPVVDRALVIGGGISGMSAALAIADQGFHVHLIEKEDRLGGFARNLTQTLEGESPLKLIGDLENKIEEHTNVTLHLDSTLIGHKGYVGAFQGIIQSPEETREVDYGAAIVTTGAVQYEPKEYRFGNDNRVLTQVNLARRISEEPEWAKTLKRVVMIQCVGSRNEDFTFCSRVCCSAAVKNSISLKKINPDIQVAVLYRDLRTFGFKELYYLKARKLGVLFFRFIPEEPPEVIEDSKGTLSVDFTDRSSHRDFRAQADAVILSAGIRPHEGSEEIAGLLRLPRTPEGFFMEAHVKLQPMEFASPGIFLAGLSHSPRFIPESIAMAKGAAQQAVKIICREEMSTPATIAVVEPSLCASCLVCVRVCPYDAPFINSEGVSEIPSAKCRGCGICAAECPAMAISLKHNTDDQIAAKIDALMESVL